MEQNMIVTTPSGRQFLVENDNVFTSDGRHVARLNESVAFGPDGKYVGTVVDREFVYDPEDCLKTGSMFVRESHVGFTSDSEVEGPSSGREPRVV
jgi:hypothetical protein